MISIATRNILIATIMSGAALIATCATSFVNAQRTGSEYENTINTTSTIAAADVQILTEALVAATGMAALEELPASRLLKFSKRWLPISFQNQILYGDPSEVEELQNELRLKIRAAEKSHISAENAKRDYQALLDSKWTGLWLRVSGYPKQKLADE